MKSGQIELSFEAPNTSDKIEVPYGGPDPGGYLKRFVDHVRSKGAYVEMVDCPNGKGIYRVSLSKSIEWPNPNLVFRSFPEASMEPHPDIESQSPGNNSHSRTCSPDLPANTGARRGRTLDIYDTPLTDAEIAAELAEHEAYCATLPPPSPEEDSIENDWIQPAEHSATTPKSSEDVNEKSALTAT